MVFSCSWHFLGSPPLFPLFLQTVLLPVPSRFSAVPPVQCGGGWGRVFLTGRVHVWVQVEQALKCSSYLGLGLAVSAPHVPGHPTCICDEGVKH